MTDKDQNLSELAKALGSRGGKSTLERHGVDYFRELNKKSQKARQKKRSK
jgi:hypothetical protein